MFWTKRGVGQLWVFNINANELYTQYLSSILAGLHQEGYFTYYDSPTYNHRMDQYNPYPAMGPMYQMAFNTLKTNEDIIMVHFKAKGWLEENQLGVECSVLPNRNS